MPVCASVLQLEAQQRERYHDHWHTSLLLQPHDMRTGKIIDGDCEITRKSFFLRVMLSLDFRRYSSPIVAEFVYRKHPNLTSPPHIASVLES